MYRNLGTNFITSYQVQSNVKETEEKSTEATEEINLFHPYRWFIGTVDPILSTGAIDRDNQAILAILAWMISRNQCVTTYFLILTRRFSFSLPIFPSLSLSLLLFEGKSTSEHDAPLSVSVLAWTIIDGNAYETTCLPRKDRRLVTPQDHWSSMIRCEGFARSRIQWPWNNYIGLVAT